MSFCSVYEYDVYEELFEGFSQVISLTVFVLSPGLAELVVIKVKRVTDSSLLCTAFTVFALL